MHHYVLVCQELEQYGVIGRMCQFVGDIGYQEVFGILEVVFEGGDKGVGGGGVGGEWRDKLRRSCQESVIEMCMKTLLNQC